MYSKRNSLILGFHGCDRTVRNNIVKTRNSDLIRSQNDWDWLGSGIYFWENNNKRALEFAKEQSKWNPSKVKKPSVLGAVINLGKCLDLMDAANLALLKASYDSLKLLKEKSGTEMPINTDFKGSANKLDRLKRNLDCAVIENLHTIMDINGFDSVRGIFTEGTPVYPNASFRTKDHIQICIRNYNCIKGYFIPRVINTSFNHV